MAFDQIKQLTGILEALSLAVILCDSDCKVRTLTRTAEALLASGRGLRLVDGRICALQPEDTHVLRDAVATARPEECSMEIMAPRTVVLRGESVPLVIDLFPLPSPQPLELTVPPSVLLVARGAAGGDHRRASVLQAMYGLTGAETEIALRLAEGRKAEVIAKDRGVAVGTVRAQIKTVLAKMGVRRQVELAARMSQL